MMNVIVLSQESATVLDRLDVQLLAPSPGDRGWDVFSLLYHLQVRFILSNC